MPESIFIRVLVLQDKQQEAEKTIEMLRSSGFAPEWKRIERKEDYLHALNSDVDLILSDYSLSQFSAKEALSLLREKGLDAPFIVIAEPVYEKAGILMMKEGASDFIFNDQTAQLGESVRSALEHTQQITDKKKADETLRQSEWLFRQFAENSSDIFWVISSNLDAIIYLSPNFEKVLGFSREQIHSMKEWYEMLHPLDRLKFMEAVRKLLASEPFVYIDYRLICPDQSIRWIRAHAFAVKDASGKIYRFAGVCRDVTKLKQSVLLRDVRHGVAMTFGQYSSLEEIVPKIIQTICETLEWKVGLFWSVDTERNTIKYFTSWHQGGEALEEFVKSAKSVVFTTNTGFAGQLLTSQKAQFVQNIYDTPYFLLSDSVRQAGLQDVIGFPIYLRGQSYGVIELFNTKIEGIDATWLELFNDISKEIGLFIERKIAEKALFASEERFKNVFEYAAVGLALLSLDGRFLQVNHSLCEMLSFSREELLQKNLKEVTFQDDLVKEMTYLNQLIAGELTYSQTEKRFVTKSKDILWTFISTYLIKDDQGSPPYFIYEVQNISQRKHSEEKLLHLAYYDILTGLPNKKLLEDTLNQSLLDASLRNERVAVFLVNVNRFKRINDTAGIAIGDLILKQIAIRLSNRIQMNDIIGNWEGDKFMIVLSTVQSAESASLFAKKILSLIKEPFFVEDRKFFLTASIGIAIFPEDANQAHLLCKNAYIAMNQAEKQGIDNFQFYTHEMLKEAQQKMLLETHLRKAIQQKELYLHYQPIIDIESNSLSSVEVLLRWNSRELGIIPPSKFIPIVEESDLIFTIGEWVLREGCLAAKALEKKGFPTIFAINLSVLQLNGQDFIEQVRHILQETGLDPKLLRFEIIESQLMKNAKEVTNILKMLKEMNIQLAIDDFGVGYSSFDYLRHFVVDRFKIDISFIHRINAESKNAAIVTSILAMGQALGIPSIAEGVETQEECELLKKIGCKEMQGNYFSYPISFEELEEYIAKQKAVKTVR